MFLSRLLSLVQLIPARCELLLGLLKRKSIVWWCLFLLRFNGYLTWQLLSETWFSQGISPFQQPQYRFSLWYWVSNICSPLILPFQFFLSMAQLAAGQESVFPPSGLWQQLFLPQAHWDQESVYISTNMGNYSDLPFLSSPLLHSSPQWSFKCQEWSWKSNKSGISQFQHWCNTYLCTHIFLCLHFHSCPIPCFLTYCIALLQLGLPPLYNLLKSSPGQLFVCLVFNFC